MLAQLKHQRSWADDDDVNECSLITASGPCRGGRREPAGGSGPVVPPAARVTLESAQAAISTLRQSTTTTPEVVSALPSAPRRFGRWLNRPRRILLTLAAVWVVAVFDLGYTLAEWGTADFVESNPVAAKVLSQSVRSVFLFKFGLLGAGSLILLLLRRHPVAELGCWFLFAAMLYVAVRWYGYFDCLLHDYVNPLLREMG